MFVKELCCRFVEKKCGFENRSEFVFFTLLDVCVGIGLRVGGENLVLEKESSDSQLRSLFGSNRVIITMIYEELLKRLNDSTTVVDVCKLYILLGLSEFFLPKINGIVHNGLFSVVDNNFGELSKYNWGGIVFQYLVGSLCEGASSIRKMPAPSYVYIVGCTYLLQIICIVS